MALVLPAGEIHLWLVATDHSVSPAQARRLLAELAPAERERHGRFHFARDRHQYLLAHALLRRVLSCYAPRPPASWRFVTNGYGKPALAGEGPRFNLSHADGLVVCALANGVRLGVDVERQDRRGDWRGLARRWLAAEEQAWLARQTEQERACAFLRLWTLKEAYVKALGLGLSASLTGFAIEPAEDGRACLVRQDPAIDVAPDRHDAAGSAVTRTAAEPANGSGSSAVLSHCQLAHWRLDSHWLALAALLDPGQAQHTVVRRDGVPLLATS
jgi:4'-phosphopantetheinyl transferase